jgi:hypothetical protein
MTILQLNPPIPVYIVDKGNGLAHFLIDYGIEAHLQWVIALDDGGEVWAVPNPKVRFQWNHSAGRVKGEKS